MKFYGYTGCGTCRNAKKWLEQHNIRFQEIPIRDQPPTKQELTKALKKYDLKKLFNTSGQDYRKLNMKEKLPTLTKEQAITLLSKNGNLIKRPFVITNNTVLVGFKEDEWEKVF